MLPRRVSGHNTFLSPLVIKVDVLDSQPLEYDINIICTFYMYTALNGINVHAYHKVVFTPIDLQRQIISTTIRSIIKKKLCLII